MEWMYYLLEANLYLLLFYGFYKLFLQDETFYNSNRYFLLLCSLTAFILPVLQLGFLKPAPIVNDALFPPPVLYTADELAMMTANPVVEPIHYTDYLYPIYLLVAFVFATKLIFSLVKIISLWAKADKKSTGKITIIELDAQKTAFSFFNLLFIHPQLAEKETVFKHELVHIKQKHSLDILFFEILQIICWFNPIIYFIKKDIKLLHEYIADDLSTNQGMQKHEYAMFLIENSFGVMPTPLTNQIFNQSILKRRINMLNKKRTANWARLRLLLALPLAGGMLCISTMAFTKSYGYVDLLPESVSFQNSDQKAIDEEDMAKKGWYSPDYIFDKNNQYKSLERRLIVVNDVAIKDNNKFYGISNAAKILFLNAKDATNKYGVKGKFGAVEIFGKATVLTYREPYVIADTAKFPPPINPNKEQIKFPASAPKPTQKKLKAPPAIEPPPAGYSGKKGQINKTPNLNPSIPKVDNVVQGYPLKNEKLKEVAIVGYAIQSAPTKVVQGYPIDNNGDQIKDVKIKAYPQSKTTKVVQGYPINNKGDQLKEVKIQAYPQSKPTKVVQGYPINNNENKIKEVKVQAYPQKSNLTGVVKGYSLKRDYDDFTGNTIKVSNVVDRTRGNKLIVTTANNARKSISIYDRWGNLVFTDKNYNNDWDGNFSNVDDLQSKVVDKGTYYYIASTIGNNSKGDLLKGYLTIE
jgi:BlaR1 peptidase M56/CHU_C Type IX secretion signal domain